MGCCGKKRAAWLQEIKSPPQNDVHKSANVLHTRTQQIEVFEYIGSGHLTLKGGNSGKVYHFRYPGDTVEILYEDTFALMAERDLRKRKAAAEG